METAVVATVTASSVAAVPAMKVAVLARSRTAIAAMTTAKVAIEVALVAVVGKSVVAMALTPAAEDMVGIAREAATKPMGMKEVVAVTEKGKQMVKRATVVGGKKEVTAADEVKVLAGETKAVILKVEEAKMADAVIGVGKRAKE